MIGTGNQKQVPRRADSCPPDEQLTSALEADPRLRSPALESHLENCGHCQERLESLAGDPALWQSVVATLKADSEELDGAAATGVHRDRLWDSSLTLPARPASGAGMDRPHGRPDSCKSALTNQLFDPPVHPEMLGRLGRFDIEALLGRGGFGTVWKAWDTELNRPVAIKILGEHLAGNATARRRFVREAQSAAAVNHPNVVPIHAVHSEATMPWLVMSFVPGQSLEDLVRKQGPLPAVQIVQLALQVASGLTAAHDQGLVHRDIKPANILVEDGSTRALITDFGLARAADDASVTQTGWLAGTPHYMSPEQARGRDIDARSDLFSLGSVLYFLATGRQAFRASQTLVVLQQIGSSTPIPPRSINAEVPATLSAIIMRLLEKDPRDRFRDAAELHSILQQYLAHLQHPQSQPRPRMHFSRRTRNRLQAAAVAAMAVIALGTMAWKIRGQWLPASPPMPASNRNELIELSRSWSGFADELGQLDRELLELESPSSPPAPGSLPSGFFSDGNGPLLEMQIEQLEADPFLSNPEPGQLPGADRPDEEPIREPPGSDTNSLPARRDSERIGA